MKYFVTIAGQTVEVEIDGNRVVVGGRTSRAELGTVAGTPVRSLLFDNDSWIVPMESDGFGKWLVQRWGARFEVEVMDERTRHIRSLIGAGTTNSGPIALKAPMPGMVVRILVDVGQTVGAGQGIAVLEAMKMENELKAQGSGVVDQVHVRPGQAVEKGALLVTFASAPTDGGSS